MELPLLLAGILATLSLCLCAGMSYLDYSNSAFWDVDYFYSKVNTLDELNPDGLHVFLSITSGASHSHLRDAIRETWLIPCIESKFCDYRFFIDCPDSKINGHLHSENTRNKDLVSISIF